jgi:hypothetical protein
MIYFFVFLLHFIFLFFMVCDITLRARNPLRLMIPVSPPPATELSTDQIGVITPRGSAPAHRLAAIRRSAGIKWIVYGDINAFTPLGFGMISIDGWRRSA